MHPLVDGLGWYGMVAIVGAYALNSFGYLESSSLIYQLLNGTGAVGIVVVSFAKKAWQPGILNLIWACIAIVAIARILV